MVRLTYHRQEYTVNKTPFHTVCCMHAFSADSGLTCAAAYVKKNQYRSLKMHICNRIPQWNPSHAISPSFYMVLCDICTGASQQSVVPRCVWRRFPKAMSWNIQATGKARGHDACSHGRVGEDGRRATPSSPPKGTSIHPPVDIRMSPAGMRRVGPNRVRFGSRCPLV